MTRCWIVSALLMAAIAGCGKEEPPAAPPADTPALPSAADEAKAKQEADQRRKQFYGDGKSRYTPQDVQGF
ncbi:hypothetical protein PIGHUM_03649 [Pigmentiphaga humi]|uniref:Lipoprotein n=1 Tax=Pigmentiphaga humi TaxID=2478468 RepID=A0A3P4B5I7_9BURK|nr:hypothetical protein [Pigmentiphaga humi]MBN9477702.1 hypothetical protein [Burkholderiales bacterium]VCU71564.1 hypothetical protein PIGHUM_03649 [Pigmentiphaga humi]